MGDSEHPDKLTNNLLDKLYNLYNSCFPIKTKIIGLKRILNPWLSKGILKSIRIKHIKYKQTLKGELCHQSYKLYCNSLAKCIRIAKKIYYNDIFDKHKKDMRVTWKLINRIINAKNNNSNKNINLVNNDNQLINDNNVADTFNQYFVN